MVDADSEDLNWNAALPLCVFPAGRVVAEPEGPDGAGRALWAREEAGVGRRAPGGRDQGGARLRYGHRLGAPAVVLEWTQLRVGERVSASRAEAGMGVAA